MSGSRRRPVRRADRASGSAADRSPRESEASYRALVNQSLEAIYVIQDDRVVFVNPAWEQLFGWSLAEIQAAPFHYMTVVAPDSMALAQGRVARTDAGLPVPPRFELRGMARDGRTFDLQCSVADIEWNGRPAVQGLYHDVTDRKRAADALERTLTLYRATVESTADGILVIGTDGRIMSFNRKLAEMWRVPDAMIAARDDAAVRRLAAGQLVDPTAFAAELAALHADTDRVARGVLRFTDGRVFEWFSQPQQFIGPPLGRVWTFRDVTQQRTAEAELRRSGSLLAAVIEGTADIVFVKDREGRYVLSNAAFGEFAGRPPTDIVGRKDEDLFAPEDCAVFRETDARVLASGKPHVFESTVVMLGARHTHLVTKSAVRDPDGQIIGVVGIARDITARKRAEEALRESEERYALAAAGANDGLWDWDLRNDEIYFSPRWVAMLGFTVGELGDHPDAWLGRVHADDRAQFRAQLDAHLAGSSALLESTHRVRHKDGGWRWMLTRGLAVRDPDGRAYRIAGSQTDVTERKLAEEQLLHDALHDALTGLPNRALFMEELRLGLDRLARRSDYAFTLLFLDLDRFKVVNDSLGHMVGDQLLVAIAHRLKRCLRPGDRVARLGGDEFTILLDDTSDVGEATRVADRIQAELAAPFAIAGHEIFTSASIGVALSATGYAEAEHVLRDADLAMYRAKAMGRARYEVFDLGMHTMAVERLELETDLRRGIERQEFCLAYQPIVSLAARRIVGFEALLRWDHPRRGRIAPDDFVAVAEETNLTPALGRFVLGAACRQLKAWQARPGVPARLGISVNLSGKHLLQPRLAAEIAEVLADSGVVPGDLTLEITENVIMENAEESAAVLAQLKALGVHIHMDDFGTGYSSLSYLHRFPVDALKIDRYFVSRMEDAENLELVRTIITLARNLGLGVVAEGVETPAQALQLRALECDLVQGYLYARPLEPAAAGELLGRDGGAVG